MLCGCRILEVRTSCRVDSSKTGDTFTLSFKKRSLKLIYIFISNCHQIPQKDQNHKKKQYQQCATPSLSTSLPLHSVANFRQDICTTQRGGSLHRRVHNSKVPCWIHSEFSRISTDFKPGRPGRESQQKLGTFAFTHASPLEKIRSICRVQCLSESSLCDSYCKPIQMEILKNLLTKCNVTVYKKDSVIS